MAPPNKRRKSSVSSEKDSCDEGSSYMAGRIVRVCLHNFKCHQFFDWVIDPNKNVITVHGSNGSGKSSIFQSILLCLGGLAKDGGGGLLKDYIRTDCTSANAKIQVWLWNHGVGASDKFAKYVIIERKISASASTYSLRTSNSVDSNGTVISTSRRQVDLLLARYDLHVDNPICWMTQERSKTFLSDLSPSKMYQMFTKASQLESTSEKYSKLDVILADIRHIRKCVNRRLADMDSKLSTMHLQRKSLTAIQEKKSEIEEIEILLLSSPLRDKLATLETIEKKITKSVSRHSVLLGHRAELEEQTAELSESDSSLSKELEDLNFRVGELLSQLTEVDRSLSDSTAQTTSYETNLKYHRQTRSSNDQLLKKTKTDMREMVEKRRIDASDSANGREISEDNQLDTLRESLCDRRQQESDIADRLRETIQRCGQTKEKMDVARCTKNKASQNERQLRLIFDRQHKSLERMEKADTATDVYSRFGQDIPKILELIAENDHLFTTVPKGPLGAFVRVLDKKDAFAVEQAMKHQLSSFIFNTKKDEVAFLHLLKENSLSFMPSRTIVRFGQAPHDTSRYEPAGFKTILSAVDIDDVDVRNALIDLSSIECTIIFENDSEAREIMDGSCPKEVKRAFTHSGANVYGSSASNPGQYRFYSCHDNPTAVMLNPARLDTGSIRTEVARLEMELSSAVKSLDTAVLEHESCKAAYEGLCSERGKLERGVEDLKVEIRKLERKLDDSDTPGEDQMATLTTSSEHFTDIIRQADAGILEMEKGLASVAMERKDLEERRNSLEDEKQTLVIEINRIEDERYDLNKKLSLNQRKVIKNDTDIVNSATASAKLTEERDKLKKEIDIRYGSLVVDLPAGYACPSLEEISKQAPSKNIREELRSLTKELEILETKCVAVPTDQAVTQLHDEITQLRKNFNHVGSLCDILEDLATLRKENFEIFYSSCVRRLSEKFREVMAARRTVGSIDIDRVAGTLTPHVQVHASKQDGRRREILMAQRESGRSLTMPPTKNAVEIHDDIGNDSGLGNSPVSGRYSQSAVRGRKLTKKRKDVLDTSWKSKDLVDQDILSLSGGERSYCTAALMVALWQVSSSPVRMMDEADVFLDGYNRKIIMNLLVQEATTSFSHTQLFLFSPHGISDLPEQNGGGVQVKIITK